MTGQITRPRWLDKLTVPDRATDIRGTDEDEGRVPWFSRDIGTTWPAFSARADSVRVT